MGWASSKSERFQMRDSVSERVHDELTCYLQKLVSSKDMISNFSANTRRALMQVRQTCSLQLHHMHLLDRSHKLQSQKKLLISGKLRLVSAVLMSSHYLKHQSQRREILEQVKTHRGVREKHDYLRFRIRAHTRAATTYPANKSYHWR